MEHLTPNGGVVSTAVHCASDGEPALQTWAWGASRGALRLLLAADALHSAGVAIMRTVLGSGLPVTSLMYAHGPRQAWRNADGACMGQPTGHDNPYETLFVQSGRGGLLAQRYSAWRLAEAGGMFNTEGEEDALMYHFAIQYVCAVARSAVKSYPEQARGSTTNLLDIPVVTCSIRVNNYQQRWSHARRTNPHADQPQRQCWRGPRTACGASLQCYMDVLHGLVSHLHTCVPPFQVQLPAAPLSVRVPTLRRHELRQTVVAKGTWV